MSVLCFFRYCVARQQRYGSSPELRRPFTISSWAMDVEFTERVAKRREKVDELFDFDGQKIGRGTYGHVYKATRRDG